MNGQSSENRNPMQEDFLEMDEITEIRSEGENLNYETCVVIESISDAIAFIKADNPRRIEK